MPATLDGRAPARDGVPEEVGGNRVVLEFVKTHAITADGRKGLPRLNPGPSSECLACFLQTLQEIRLDSLRILAFRSNPLRTDLTRRRLMLRSKNLSDQVGHPMVSDPWAPFSSCVRTPGWQLFSCERQDDRVLTAPSRLNRQLLANAGYHRGPSAAHAEPTLKRYAAGKGTWDRPWQEATEHWPVATPQ